MSVPFFQNLTFMPQDQLKSTTSRSLVTDRDAKGNFSQWEVINVRQEMLINGRCYLRDFSQSVLVVDRLVQKPPFVFQRSLTQAPESACSPPRPSAVSFVTAPPTLRTAHALSALLPTALRPLILTLPFVIYRAGGNDNLVVRIIDRVAQLLNIPGNSSETACSKEGKQNASDNLPGAEDIKAKLTHLRLVALLSEAISNQGQELQPHIQKALLDFLNAENRLHQAEGEKISFNMDLSSVDVFSQSAATVNSGVLAREKLNAAAIRVSQNSTTDINVGNEGPAKQVTAKTLAGSESGGREHGHGERGSKAGSGSEAVRPDTGKMNMNQSTAAAIPNQGASALNQPSQFLASGVPVTIQPPALLETGQKQMPPIILPNVNPGAGNRSERRKSRKELEEEEEKEREGLSWLFDDEDSFDEPDEPWDGE